MVLRKLTISTRLRKLGRRHRLERQANGCQGKRIDWASHLKKSGLDVLLSSGSYKISLLNNDLQRARSEDAHVELSVCRRFSSTRFGWTPLLKKAFDCGKHSSSFLRSICIFPDWCPTWILIAIPAKLSECVAVLSARAKSSKGSTLSSESENSMSSNFSSSCE